MNTPETLIKQLVDLRKSQNLTQTEFANLLEMSQPNLARLENGGRKPSIDLLCKYANLVGATIDVKISD